MGNNKTEIFVYAHWAGMSEPKIIGTLSAQHGKGRNSFSFEYSKEWLNTNERLILDPDISFYSGHQFPNSKENFGVFLDSMPDTWGRTLMKRKHALKSRENKQKIAVLHDTDYLLGVYDESRMGALRFKLEKDGAFLDDSKDQHTPPWSSIRELQYSAEMLENNTSSDEANKWLNILIAPGSSLGGARPKANILDNDNNLWIAKFPSKNDVVDKAKWEYLAYLLSLKADINMSESKIEKISGNYHTFFTKRFDRLNNERIHFASAMTMTGNNEDTIRDNTASYLDIAEFIQFNGAQPTKDLHQLWKRIVFNIAISNTDDHLRNHGFILTNKGWILSPAYDVNPSTDKNGLALNIDMYSNTLDINLSRSVGEYFQLDTNGMDLIIDEVNEAVDTWKVIAEQIGISRSDIQLMEHAFKVL